MFIEFARRQVRYLGRGVRNLFFSNPCKLGIGCKSPDVVHLIREGEGPATPGEFLTTITGRLFSRMEPVLKDLEDTLSKAEEQSVLGNIEEISNMVAIIRKRTTIFTRYILPQRAVLEGLTNVDIAWLTSEHKEVLIEGLDRVIHRGVTRNS